MEFLFAGLVSAFVACVILATKSYHLKYTAKGHSGAARQSAHRVPTPRVGGIAIFSGFIAGTAMLPSDVAAYAVPLLLSCIAVFVGGLGEDIGRDVSPKTRLILSFISALCAIAIFRAWIGPLGSPYLNWITSTLLGATLFTVLISGGVAHATNLIDGLNGLAMGVCMLIAGGLAYLAYSVSDAVILNISLLLMCSILGLFLFNFPFGKIFLGDAGAYTLGHVLIWLSILLVARNPEISPYAILLIFFWPIMDMLFAIFRRVVNREPIGAPDRLHFHQLVMRGLGLIYFNRTQRNVTNPLATVLVLPMTAVPIVAAQFLWHDIGQSAVALLFFGALFIVTYRSLFIVILQRASTRHQRTAAKTSTVVADPRVTPAE
jgi:UDP-GlcNAc:undecaprenyl-phosphate GlcNAc-1-phosphate transferase